MTTWAAARRWTAGLALALGLAPASGAQVQGFQYSRQIQVPAPGWVRVPLDLAAIQHVSPGAADLHVFSPAGGEVAVVIEPAPPRIERRPVESVREEPTEDGWQAVVDVGADPAPHERLFLSSARSSLERPARIEASPDGASWQPLAAGEPGPGESTGEISISYPVTPIRFLRLHWPKRAEPPRISALQVEAVTGPSLAIATPNADCRPGAPGSTLCLLPLPAAGQIVRRLTLEVESAGPVGYRVDAPDAGTWRPFASGVWQPSGGRTRHLVEDGREPVADAMLKLELHGVGKTGPRLASYGLDLTVQTVVFQAETPGRYTIVYGGAPRAETRRSGAPRDARAVWLEAGPESERDLPPLPAAATSPTVRIGSRRLSGNWRVVAPAAQPGQLVRLELTPVVYGPARADLGNLRVVAGERQIPFYRWSPAAPALAAEERDLKPLASGRSRESEVEVHLPEPGLPLTQLVLTGPATPLRRALAVRYLEPARAPRRENARRDPPSPIRDTWECQPEPPLPCRDAVKLPGHAPSVLEVRFRDGDNPPLSGLAATVWRRRDVLFFVWPDSEEPVRLLAGPVTLKAPSYDLQAMGDVLLTRPWQPAELSLEGTAPLRVEPRWSRWIKPLILLLATAGLILLLRRILMEA